MKQMLALLVRGKTWIIWLAALALAATAWAADGGRYQVRDVAPSPGLAASGPPAPFAGVLGEYYATRECGELLWTRLDNRVGFTDWEGLRETGRRESALSARWTGLLHVSTSGVQVLEHRSDGLLTVSVNGKPLIRYQKANPAGDTTEVALERGEYPVEIEYRNVGSEARLQLSWRPPQGKSRPLAGGDLLLRLSPGMPPQIAEMFDLDQPVERHRVPGLRGQYFLGVDRRAFGGAGVGGDLLHQQRDRYLGMRGTYPVVARDSRCVGRASSWLSGRENTVSISPASAMPPASGWTVVNSCRTREWRARN